MTERLHVPKVQLESPFGAQTREQIATNVQYAFLAMHDSLVNHGEAPFASHLLYTLALDDTLADERALGIERGLELGSDADLTAVYLDLGISRGMEYGIKAAEKLGREVTYRHLFDEALALDEITEQIRQNSPLAPNALSALFARTHNL